MAMIQKCFTSAATPQPGVLQHHLGTLQEDGPAMSRASSVLCPSEGAEIKVIWEDIEGSQAASLPSLHYHCCCGDVMAMYQLLRLHDSHSVAIMD